MKDLDSLFFGIVCVMVVIAVGYALSSLPLSGETEEVARVILKGIY